MGNTADHALLSPSGAKKWMACPPSVRLEEGLPDSSGAAAREGTLAHAISEILLHLAYSVARLPHEGMRKAHEKRLKDQLQALIDEDALVEDFYGPAMLEYCEQYVAFVMEKFAEVFRDDPEAKLYIEKRLDLTEYLKEGFGTGDAGILSRRKFVGIDLKYGKGVEVSAIENDQMKIYALGWLNLFPNSHDIETIEVHIFQPRIDNLSEWSTTTAELRKWGAEVLRPAAKLAWAGQGLFKAGNHCQFCRVKATCKALASYNLELGAHDFADPVFLTDAEAADIFKRKKMFINWIEAVVDHMSNQATGHGKQYPGLKVVEGRSDRYISDEQQLIQAFKTLGCAEEALYNKKLIALGDLEKLAGGPKKFQALAADFMKKPQGKPALVDISDKRPSFDPSAKGADAFDDGFELVPTNKGSEAFDDGFKYDPEIFGGSKMFIPGGFQAKAAPAKGKAAAGGSKGINASGFVPGGFAKKPVPNDVNWDEDPVDDDDLL